MRFDWYSATVHEAEPEEVLPVLQEDLCDVNPMRPMHGYGYGAEVVRGDRRFAMVWWGGNGGGVHVQSSGPDSDLTASKLRAAFPRHHVTRADVCQDYSAPGAWDVLSKLALEVADAQGIRVNHAGDWHRGQEGRTLYLGSPSSVARARCYEKGRQIGRDPDLVRMELCVRPKGEARLACATAEPRAFWGSARWSLALADRLGMSDVERMRCGTVYRVSDVERTRFALVKQYGPALLAWAAELGTPEALGVELVTRVQELQLRRARESRR